MTNERIKELWKQAMQDIAKGFFQKSFVPGERSKGGDTIPLYFAHLLLAESARPEVGAHVFVAEGGEYEQRYIVGVFRSLEDAAAFIRQPYVAPYIVRWDEPTPDGDDTWTLTGHFSRVDGYCGDGPIEWTIKRHPLSNMNNGKQS